MKIKILGGLLVAFLAITTVAEAQAPAPLVRHRQHRQERRIAAIFARGKLPVPRHITCVMMKEGSAANAAWPWPQAASPQPNGGICTANKDMLAMPSAAMSGMIRSVRCEI